MPVYNMGVDFQKAQEEAQKASMPAEKGVYTLQILEVSELTGKQGNPKLCWTFSIINASNPDYNSKKINYFTNLPHKGSFKGVQFLTALCAAIKKPWTGSNFNTDECIGATCMANVKVSDDGKWNEIESFI